MTDSENNEIDRQAYNPGQSRNTFNNLEEASSYNVFIQTEAKNEQSEVFETKTSDITTASTPYHIPSVSGTTNYSGIEGNTVEGELALQNVQSYEIEEITDGASFEVDLPTGAMLYTPAGTGRELVKIKFINGNQSTVLEISYTIASIIDDARIEVGELSCDETNNILLGTAIDCSQSANDADGEVSQTFELLRNGEVVDSGEFSDFDSTQINEVGTRVLKVISTGLDGSANGGNGGLSENISTIELNFVDVKISQELSCDKDSYKQ